MGPSLNGEIKLLVNMRPSARWIAKVYNVSAVPCRSSPLQPIHSHGVQILLLLQLSDHVI